MTAWQRAHQLVDRLGLAAVRLLHAIAGTRRRGPVRRSLWTGTPILNMAVNARAERLLGIEADSLVDHTYFITSAFDYDFSRFTRLRLVRWALPYFLLAWAAWRYDRFHFYCDRGLLRSGERFRFNPRELGLLSDLGKEIYFWTYGADVRTQRRTRQLGEVHGCLECPAPGSACVCDDARGQANYDDIRRHARAVFSMGDMIEYTPGSRNDLYFWPIELDADAGRRYRPVFPDPHCQGPVRIVHAPNHRHYKGSRFLFAAVEQLQAEGLPVELALVEGVPNDDALGLYRTADLVFDQCLYGFHGFLAIEAMALGKPVVCYIRRPEEYLLCADECPIVNTHIDTLVDDLRSLVRDRARLHALGQQGRRYVEQHFTPQAFADRLARAYRELGVAA